MGSTRDLAVEFIIYYCIVVHVMLHIRNNEGRKTRSDLIDLVTPPLGAAHRRLYGTPDAALGRELLSDHAVLG